MSTTTTTTNHHHQQQEAQKQLEIRCKLLQDKVQKCQAKRGGGSMHHADECRMAELQAKRCRAFLDCPHVAEIYYGSTAFDDDKMDNNKALCAAWQEARIFGDPRVMGIDSPNNDNATNKKRNTQIFEHHRRAYYKVQGSLAKRRYCQDVSDALTKCLRQAAKTTTRRPTSDG